MNCIFYLGIPKLSLFELLFQDAFIFTYVFSYKQEEFYRHSGGNKLTQIFLICATLSQIIIIKNIVY